MSTSPCFKLNITNMSFVISNKTGDTGSSTQAISTSSRLPFISQSTSHQMTSKRNSGELGRSLRKAASTSARLPSGTKPNTSRRRGLNPAMFEVELSAKIDEFILSLSPSSPMGELAKENRSLHQRIAALQRNETELLNENQELSRKLSLTQRYHDSRKREWKVYLVTKEQEFATRVEQLELEISQLKDTGLAQRSDSGNPDLDDKSIISWFVAKGTAWCSWVEEFAHPDSRRVQNGLHPLQLREVSESVKYFVQLTAQGGLPRELLDPVRNIDFQTTHILLHGMLVHFITAEAFASPFWMFDAISTDASELESPSVLGPNSMSPIGFRMDLALWDSRIAPPRHVTSRLMPMPATTKQPQHGQQDTQNLPRLITSVRPLNLTTGPAETHNLPSRQTMEDLARTLSQGMFTWMLEAYPSLFYLLFFFPFPCRMTSTRIKN